MFTHIEQLPVKQECDFIYGVIIMIHKMEQQDILKTRFLDYLFNTPSFPNTVDDEPQTLVDNFLIIFNFQRDQS